MITPTFHRRAAILAFLAMGLLMLLPTMGRVVDGLSMSGMGQPASMSVGDRHAMHMAHGQSASPHTDHASNPPSSPMPGMVCSYCFILTGLALPVLLLLYLLPVAPDRRQFRRRYDGPLPSPDRSQRGCRDPPSLL